MREGGDAIPTSMSATTVLETVVGDASGRSVKHPVDAESPSRHETSDPNPSLDASLEMENVAEDDATAGFGSAGPRSAENDPPVDPVETLVDESAAAAIDVDGELETFDAPEAVTASILTFLLLPSTILYFLASDAAPTTPPL